LGGNIHIRPGAWFDRAKKRGAGLRSWRRFASPGCPEGGKLVEDGENAQPGITGQLAFAFQTLPARKRVPGLNFQATAGFVRWENHGGWRRPGSSLRKTDYWLTRPGRGHGFMQEGRWRQTIWGGAWRDHRALGTTAAPPRFARKPASSLANLNCPGTNIVIFRRGRTKLRGVGPRTGQREPGRALPAVAEPPTIAPLMGGGAGRPGQAELANVQFAKPRPPRSYQT